MPTYEYVCSKCDHQFDVFQAITEKPLTVCPKDKCGKKSWGQGAVKRVIGAGAGVIFKGSGFYSTDYRSKSYQEAAKKDSPATPSTTTGDAKPAAKPETVKPSKAKEKSE
jgi:putative FmdB family regulatory protein